MWAWAWWSEFPLAWEAGTLRQVRAGRVFSASAGAAEAEVIASAPQAASFAPTFALFWIEASGGQCLPLR